MTQMSEIEWTDVTWNPVAGPLQDALGLTPAFVARLSMQADELAADTFNLHIGGAPALGRVNPLIHLPKNINGLLAGGRQ